MENAARAQDITKISDQEIINLVLNKFDCASAIMDGNEETFISDLLTAVKKNKDLDYSGVGIAIRDALGTQLNPRITDPQFQDNLAVTKEKYPLLKKLPDIKNTDDLINFTIKLGTMTNAAVKIFGGSLAVTLHKIRIKSSAQLIGLEKELTALETKQESIGKSLISKQKENKKLNKLIAEHSDKEKIAELKAKIEENNKAIAEYRAQMQKYPELIAAQRESIDNFKSNALTTNQQNIPNTKTYTKAVKAIVQLGVITCKSSMNRNAAAPIEPTYQIEELIAKGKMPEETKARLEKAMMTIQTYNMMQQAQKAAENKAMEETPSTEATVVVQPEPVTQTPVAAAADDKVIEATPPIAAAIDEEMLAKEIPTAIPVAEGAAIAKNQERVTTPEQDPASKSTEPENQAPTITTQRPTELVLDEHKEAPAIAKQAVAEAEALVITPELFTGIAFDDNRDIAERAAKLSKQAPIFLTGIYREGESQADTIAEAQGILQDPNMLDLKGLARIKALIKLEDLYPKRFLPLEIQVRAKDIAGQIQNLLASDQTPIDTKDNLMHIAAAIASKATPEESSLAALEEQLQAEVAKIETTMKPLGMRAVKGDISLSSNAATHAKLKQVLKSVQTQISTVSSYNEFMKNNPKIVVEKTGKKTGKPREVYLEQNEQGQPVIVLKRPETLWSKFMHALGFKQQESAPDQDKKGFATWLITAVKGLVTKTSAKEQAPEEPLIDTPKDVEPEESTSLKHEPQNKSDDAALIKQIADQDTDSDGDGDEGSNKDDDRDGNSGIEYP